MHLADLGLLLLNQLLQDLLQKNINKVLFFNLSLMLRFEDRGVKKKKKYTKKPGNEQRNSTEQKN